MFVFSTLSIPDSLATINTEIFPNTMIELWTLSNKGWNVQHIQQFHFGKENLQGGRVQEYVDFLIVFLFFVVTCVNIINDMFAVFIVLNNMKNCMIARPGQSCNKAVQ